MPRHHWGTFRTILEAGTRFDDKLANYIKGDFSRNNDSAAFPARDQSAPDAVNALFGSTVCRGHCFGDHCVSFVGHSGSVFGRKHNVGHGFRSHWRHNIGKLVARDDRIIGGRLSCLHFFVDNATTISVDAVLPVGKGRSHGFGSGHVQRGVHRL